MLADLVIYTDTKFMHGKQSTQVPSQSTDHSLFLKFQSTVNALHIMNAHHTDSSESVLSE